jgi:DNA-directed RNA polymerase beta subunit
LLQMQTYNIWGSYIICTAPIFSFFSRTVVKNFMISSNINNIQLSKQSALTNDTELALYPNPSDNGYFVVNGSDILVDLQVLNSTGQIIINKSGVMCKDLLLDISNEPPGIYFVLVITNDEIINKKIIKSK